MRIFVTGASGWIGSAVVPELLGAGHEVVGLARSEPSAQRLEDAGALVHRGDLDDPDGLAKAAADSDGVIHLAFQHEVAFGGELRRRRRRPTGGPWRPWARPWPDSDRPLVLASGMLGLAMGRAATEDDGLVPDAEIRANPAGLRAATALLDPVPAGHRRPLVGAAPSPDGARRRRQRIHGHPGRRSPAARRGRIRGGRHQPLAGGAPFRRRPTGPSGRRGGPGRLRAARGRRRGRPVPRDRRSNGPAPRPPHGVGGTPPTPSSTSRHLGHFVGAGQPGHGRRHQGAARVGADRAPACSRTSSRTTTTAGCDPGAGFPAAGIRASGRTRSVPLTEGDTRALEDDRVTASPTRDLPGRQHLPRSPTMDPRTRSMEVDR